MSRLVVVLPLFPLREGDTFAVSEWPLHITVLPPFQTDASPADVAGAIAAAANDRTAMTAVAGSDEMFGRRHDVAVTVLQENKDLTRLHNTLVDAVRPFAVSAEEQAYMGRGFRPHVTIKGTRRVAAGDVLALRQIALVDMAPRASGGRAVLATLALPDPDGS